MEKATGISPVDWWCCVVMGMICYDVLSCRDDHHRCYNHHHENLTVSPVAGRGNVGWRPCGETRPNWIYRQHHLRHTRWRHQCQRLLSKSRSCVMIFCPSPTESTSATDIPSSRHPHHHQADHKLVRAGPPIQDPPKLCLTPPPPPDYLHTCSSCWWWWWCCLGLKELMRITLANI